MINPTVFITREISTDSVLNDLKHNTIIIGKSLILFSKLDFNPLISTTWIFFYSSRGVQHYFDGIKDKDQIKTKKIAVMGKGTSSAFQLLFDRAPDFVGDGSKDYSVSFLNTVDEDITFIKGKNSLSSVEKNLDRSNCQALIVYNNVPDFTVNIPESDIYVITSPMNAEVFMSKVSVSDHNKVMAIGATTNQRLIKLGYLNAVIPDSPNEVSIANMLKSMIHE